MNTTAFLFPGQGSQSVGMGKDFYDRSARARELFERADGILGYKISRLCFEGPDEELRMTFNTQPALLIVSTIAYSLLGLEPGLAAGHSLGEYSALVAAGSLDFEAAVFLVHKRGLYMQEAVPAGVGAMAAVLGANPDSLLEALQKVKSGTVEVANWNSPDQLVIAGHRPAVEEALALIRPPRSVWLPVSAPFHTSLMKPAADKLCEDLDQTAFRDPRFPLISNVDAKVITQGDEAREALKRQVSGTVLWSQSMDVLPEWKIRASVELGAGRVLSGLLKRISRSWQNPPAFYNVENWESLEKTQRALSAPG